MNSNATMLRLLYRAVKAEAIFMILQIENREPEDFKHSPTENIKGTFTDRYFSGWKYITFVNILPFTFYIAFSIVVVEYNACNNICMNTCRFA